MLFLKLNRAKRHDDKTVIMSSQLAIIFIHWITLYPYQIGWTTVVQDKAYLSSGQLLNNQRSCPLDR